MIQKVLFSIALVLLAVNLSAQSNTNDLSKQIQNPIASLISLPFQNNTDFGILQYDPLQQIFYKGTRNTLNIQPVVPFSLSEKVALIARAIIPIISLPLDVDSDLESQLRAQGVLLFPK